MNKIIKSSLIIIFILIGLSSVKGQPGGGDGTPSDPGDNPVPITGIEYLIAAGAAFGAKKLYDKRKK